MAHGWRRRAATFGAAVAVCTGLGGCTTEDKKPLTPPAAKGSTLTPPASVRTTPPPTAGTGVPPTGFGSAAGGTTYPSPPAPRTQPGGGTFPGANPLNSGAMGVPTAPGTYGTGAPLPGSSGLGGGPQTGSQYSPVGASSALPTPPSQPFGSSAGYSAPAAPVRPPVTGTRPGDPPAPQLLDVPMPTAAPPVGGLNPGVGPSTDGFPAAPPYPTSPPAALPNAPFPVPPSR